MIRIAPKSSIIARAIKKIFKDIGIREPNKDNTPIENAISVAEGIAQPLSVLPVSKLMITYIIAGIAIPPTAPIIGNKACFGLESSP